MTTPSPTANAQDVTATTAWQVIPSPTDAELSAVQGAYLVADLLPVEDASLIAAAPELLEACISARMQLRVAVIAHSGGLYDHENVGEHLGVAKLDAAIAKATAA